MINISGLIDNEVREFQAAVELQRLILSAWPKLQDSQQDQITIVVGAKCHGQIVRDIDLILLGTFRSAIFYKPFLDRKSTRLNSSHGYISYAVFCFQKKNKIQHRCFIMALRLARLVWCETV